MQRKAVSKGSDSYENKIKLHQTQRKFQFAVSRSRHRDPFGHCSTIQHPSGTESSSGRWNPCPGKVSPPKPPLSPCVTLGAAVPGAVASTFCPGCAFLSVLSWLRFSLNFVLAVLFSQPSSPPGEMNRAWVQPGSEGKARSRGGNLPPTASTF